MRYYQQLNKHDPENGSIGDCLRTCVGCLLDKRPEDVPHFGADADPFATMDAYLRTVHRVALMVHVAGSKAAYMEYMGRINPDVRYILIGDGHAVVCCGNAVEHDPSWNQKGVNNPQAAIFILGEGMRR